MAIERSFYNNITAQKNAASGKEAASCRIAYIGKQSRLLHPAIHPIAMRADPRIGCGGRLLAVLRREHHAVDLARLPLELLQERNHLRRLLFQFRIHDAIDVLRFAEYLLRIFEEL